MTGCGGENNDPSGPGGPGKSSAAAAGAGGDAGAANSAAGNTGSMGRRHRAGGDLGVNKKGTPLYSREDIREQYCINDKELQVLDKSGRKSLLGCFSNQGQAGGSSPCARTGPGGKRSILGSCIARTTSEEDLHALEEKRPISPGQRGTTWNGKLNEVWQGCHIMFLLCSPPPLPPV